MRLNDIYLIKNVIYQDKNKVEWLLRNKILDIFPLSEERNYTHTHKPVCVYILYITKFMHQFNYIKIGFKKINKICHFLAKKF